MNFESLCTMFEMREPYYGILLSSMRRIPNLQIDTMAVAMSGSVFELHYNPKWVDAFDIEANLEFIKHEMLHLAFNHFTLWDETAQTQGEQMVRNFAADAEVNCYLDLSKVPDKAGLIKCADFGLEERKGTMVYYKYFKSKYNDMTSAQQQYTTSQSGAAQNGNNQSSQGKSNIQSNTSTNSGNNSNSSQPGNNQQSNNQNNNTSKVNKDDPNVATFTSLGKPFDDHSKWPSTESNASKEVLENAVDALVVMAAEECEKNQGTIPGELKKRIDSLRKKARPVADWKRFFRRFIGNEYTDIIRKSKKRESNRFPDAPGNRRRRKANVLVAIDTSGSVSMPEYREFFAQIQTLKEKASFHVVECDTKICHEYDFNGKVHEELHGFGGTSFQPPIDMFIANRKKYECLVYFTDGYAAVPKNTPKNTIWVISSKGDQSDRKKYTVNGASVAFIKK